MRASVSPAWPAVVCVLLLGCTAPTAAATSKITTSPQLAPGICPSKDIRSQPESLKKLQGCRVIEGHLSIVVMERATHKSYENISFPELREVTGYVIIYRMNGITNFGDLFPNLSVIRGMQLFKDFALVVFDNVNLESVGLRSLTKIERGAVRIQNNDRLCYTNTIDWGKISPDPRDNIIRSNYDERLCGFCPHAQSRNEGRKQSEQHCPADSTGRLLCWDDRHCQAVCQSACGDRGCLRRGNGTCCHASCLGGCDGPTPRDCHVCRNYSFGYNKDWTCMEHCPAGTYALNHRCVTEQECRNTASPLTDNADAGRVPAATIPAYKIFKDKCIYSCPSGYVEVGNIKNATCGPCPATGCVRECAGGKIDSVASAELYRGCTHVTGTLEIALRASGGNTMSVLETSLGEIRVIEGGLKVTRSYPLVSLMFLKNLRKIVGSSTENKGQSFHIFSNPNLELLWNWTTHGPIEITHGKLFIHFNPKLCLNQIAPLKNMTRDPESTFSQNEVSEDNNGDQALCFQDVLNLRLSELKKQMVVLTWNSYCLDDNRKLLGYSIYYTVAEHNVTLYERRDACSDTWSVFDKTVEDPRNSSRKNDKNYLAKPCDDVQPLFQPLTQLIPYTRYAAYVKTYTTKQDKKGAQSPIIYFRTLPSNPSPPLDVTVESLTSHSVYIRWSPPLNPNGSITMYFVEIQANSYNRPKILSVNNNYCSDPSALANMVAARSDEISKKQEEKTTGEVKNGSCACKEEMKPSTRFNEAAEAERRESSDFENALQNQVYIKNDRSKPKTPANRIRRSIDNNLSKLVLLSEYNSPKFGFKYSNATDDEGYVRSLYYEFDGKARSLTVTNMRHCTWYTVNIWACRVKHENESLEDYEKTWCSTRVRENFRTTPLSDADMVSNVQAEILPSNKTVPEVNVTWEPPKNPNGFVVAYNIHHSRVEENSQAQDVGLQSCIPADDYEANGHGYVLRNLAPGNYSIKVTPVTLAIAGNASAHTYVFIPERTIETGHEWIWGVVGGCLIMMMVLAGGIWYVRRGLLPNAEANKLFASVNPEYVSTVYVPDEWEVPRGNIEFIRELGQGSFGMVYEGIAKNIEKGVPETRCAVKTVNEHATDRERIEFLNEASVMKAFDTHHVVKLLGVVSRGQPTLVVMELMELGDLKTYLRSHRPDSDNSLPGKEKNGAPPTLQNILQMAIEIADGMAYLSAKKFVHRDLAARNCMVTGELTVKVGDFGMTRDIYETDYYRKGTKGLLPVRWMSPESLKDGVFSSSSDVWSYGVVLWEMATLAMQPYQGLSNEQVLRYVVEGGVMERPEHCPDRLYDLMRQCWAHRASQRPHFLRLVADLVAHAVPAFRHRSFFHSTQGQELYALQRTAMEEEQEMPEVNVGAVATGSGSNLFGVSGRLASWVRELSSLRSRTPEDAAEPLQPAQPATTPC